MGFTQGLSGLNAASKQLEVIGNNVANANTVGFKASEAQFADVFAAALTGAGSAQIGIGARLATVAQQFVQGNISVTNNTLDMAINGPGFFILDNGHGTGYSRNGQFQLDKNGFIVSSTGHFLQGYAIDPVTQKPIGSPTALSIPTGIADAQATGAGTGAGAKGVVVGLNLDSTGSVLAPAFDPLNPNSYNNSTSTTTYDSKGVAQTTTMYFKKTAANTWDVYTTVIDPTTGSYLYANPTIPPVAGSWAADGTLVFGTNGRYSSWTPNPAMNTATTGFTPPGANLEQIPFDFSASTQFGAAFGVTKLTQDGYTSGQLSGFSISQDGIILGRYSNGISKPLGQVALATFPNNQGLQPLGQNEWAESSASGQPTTNAPGTGNNGVLQTSSVEDSNVDLSSELVNMITAQRVYQANAQTIKTQDSVLQTLVNLR
ncbi:MAG: flagellar hook protein FlgE [Nitrosomonadales bacterium]|nr:flagellar hook protein FlgE [Nitrosomonadales bacterium]